MKTITRSGAERTSTVSGLADDALLAQTRKLARIEQQLNVTVIDHLREIEGLQDGSITLTTAAQLQNAFDRQRRNRHRRERGPVVGSGPAVPRQDSLLAPPDGTAEPEPALDVSARKALVKQAAGKSTRQVQDLLAGVDPELALPADKVRPLGNGRYEMKVVVDAECHRALEQLRGLLSHVDPHMTLGQLVGRLAREGLDRHDPARLPPPRRGLRRRQPAAASLRRRRRSATRTVKPVRRHIGTRNRHVPPLRHRSGAHRPGAPSRRPSDGRSGSEMQGAAATWTRVAGAAAPHGTCCRPTTASPSPWAAARSRPI